jgi:hypothetical protein
MYKELEKKLTNVLKAEFNYVKTHENDKNKRLNRMNDIFHITQVLANFDELEPIIADYLNKKARKEKFER